MDTIILNGQWNMKEAGTDKEYPVTVPGSVLSALLDAGAIEDPYYRENEYEARELFWKDYEFARTFTVSAEQLSMARMDLVCYGLDTLAVLTINGKELARTNNMHRTYRFAVKEYLREGENEIRILFQSTLKYMKEYQPAEGKEIHVIPVGGMEGNQYLRKAHSMFGWDWGAQLPDAGIWRDIELECYDEARIEDVRIHQLHENGKVTVSVDVELDVIEERMYKVSLQLSPSWYNGAKLPKIEVQAKTAIVPVGKKHLSTQIEVEKPKLWWPHGLGDQNLYKLEISLKPAGITGGGMAATAITQIPPIDAKEYTIGLRTLTVSQDKDEWGKQFCFMVNGTKFFSMGANYIPEDCIYSRITPQVIEHLIKSAVRANYNTMRVWGGGYYPSDCFYDLCDRYGLVVWQDLMYACNVYDLTPEFEETILAETRDNVRRLRHHASLGLWCGNNEIESAWAYWGNFRAESAYLKADYIKMFDFLLPREVQKYDDTTFFWHSSPSSGGSLDEPSDPNRGDMHYWDVWHGGKPFSDYQKHFFRFCSEFGFQSFPGMKTMEQFAKPEDFNIFSPVMESHQKNGTANEKILHYIAGNYKYPKDFESLVYVSQILQGVAIKSGVEHWRRNRGRCMGSLYWQINDDWPVASWASIDYYGRWKALHYMAQTFFAPKAGSIVRTMDEEGYFSGVQAHVTNETAFPAKVKVTMNLRKMNFEIVRSREIEADMEPFSSAMILEEDYSDILLQEMQTSREPSKCFPKEGRISRRDVYVEAIFEITDEHGDIKTQIEHEELLACKHLNIPVATVLTEVSEEEKEYLIKVKANAFAPFVELDFPDADVIFEDNYFTITNEQERVVRLAKNDILKGEFADAQDVAKRLTVCCLQDAN